MLRSSIVIIQIMISEKKAYQNLNTGGMNLICR